MNTLYTGITCPNPAYVHTPLIEIAPVDDDAALQRVAHDIDRYDYVLFTSRYAAKYVGAMFAHARRIVSIGSTTTAALYNIGAKEVWQVDDDNSYGVISWFRKQPRGRVLIPRSNLALSIIPEGLRQSGFEVDTVTAYINSMPKNLQRVDLSHIDRIVFTSPSTIDNFIRLYGSLPEGKVFVFRGQVTKNYLQTKIKQQNL
ncbi:MAG: uroporphyrinogen-III synthase [Prevotella sp.]|nr:uroporphyrinogen-III synthase [Prevotella sp.]